MATTLPWIILLAPLVSAALILLVTNKARWVSSMISVGAVLVSFVATLLLFTQPYPTAPNQFLWINLGAEFQIPIGLTLDKLSEGMLVVVTTVGALVHIFSLGYMADDEGKSRYFAGLSLFMFSMLGIVLANNFVMMFIFWELVGVSSYILIGHWFTKDTASAAANKAFISNRLGDFGFMAGILMVWFATKSLVFTEIAGHWPGHQHPFYLAAAAILIFCGAVGKSAQFPLHVWLPDAMEGPTPVSALIHAATMVAAGVYMLCRVFFLVEASPEAQSVIAWIGTITAVLAALMATQQNDIKRILAYSTLSQLGYMIAAVGLTSHEAAMYHLFTHAFFKAALFLGSGAVIYAMHHEQDIWKMGALSSHVKTTFGTFLVATLALTGCPGLSGFLSKETILGAAYEHNHAIFWALMGVAFLTAFYMFRLVVVVFFAPAKSDAAGHAHEAPAIMTMPLIVLAVLSIIGGYSFVAGHFIELPEEKGVFFVTALAVSLFAAGAAGAFVLYRGKKEEPLKGAIFTLFKNKFYIDEAYAFLIKWTQDLLACYAAWFDRWVLDWGIVRWAFAGGSYGLGLVLRFLQIGNLQAYAFLFGAGVVALIYYILFR